MIFADVSEFLEAKFNLNLAFVQISIGSYWLKIIIYIVHMFWNMKFIQYLEQTQQAYGKNKFMLGERKL